MVLRELEDNFGNMLCTRRRNFITDHLRVAFSSTKAIVAKTVEKSKEERGSLIFSKKLGNVISEETQKDTPGWAQRARMDLEEPREACDLAQPENTRKKQMAH